MEIRQEVLRAMLKYPKGFAFKDRLYICKDMLLCAKRALSYRYMEFADMLFFYHSKYYFPLPRPPYLYCYAIIRNNLIIFHRESPFEINNKKSRYDNLLRRWIICEKISQS